MKHGVPLLLFLMVAGCGQDSDTDAPPDAAPTDEGAVADVVDEPDLPATVDAPDVAPEPDLPKPPAGCEGALSWAVGTELPSPRDHHGTFVLESATGAHLYVAGGNNYKKQFADVWRAPIGQDGSVGSWVEDTAMPSPRSGQGVALIDDRVIFTGGKVGGKELTQVLVGHAGDDGAIVEWATGPALPSKRFHGSADAFDGVIYATGGLLNSVSQDTVFASTWSDGQLSAWEDARALPQPRSHHSSFAAFGALYVIGGLDGNPAGAHETLSTVIRAEIGDEGSLGEWQSLADFPDGISTHGNVLNGACVYVVGGLIGKGGLPQWSQSVYRAELDAEGALGDWQLMDGQLPSRRSHVHQAPLWDGRIYSVGGSFQKIVHGDVAIGAP